VEVERADVVARVCHGAGEVEPEESGASGDKRARHGAES
jgi:hypothetical protein